MQHLGESRRGRWALSAALLALALGCGARSALDCFGETCAALEAGGGSGGATASSGGVSGIGGSAGASQRPPGAGLGGSRGGLDPEIPVPPDTPIDSGGSTGEPETGNSSLFCPVGGGVDGGVNVSTYAELERYQNCETIRGDLIVRGADFVDLGPLSNLREVHGSVILNTTGSLRGLSALLSVDSLVIEQFGGRTLTPLSHLAVIRDRLSITGAALLTDLDGLSALETVQSIELINLPALRTLSSLIVPNQLDSFQAIDTPQLTDVSALAPLEEVGALALQNTGLGDLNGLQNLTRATSVALVNDASLGSLSQLERLGSLTLLMLDGVGLSNVNGLEGLGTLENTILQNNPNSNPVLARLPVFSNAEVLQKIYIRDNPQLATGPSFPLATSADFITVSENPSLTQLNGFASLTRARAIEIVRNTALVALDFSQLTSARNVRIKCNTSLDEASLEPLSSVSAQSSITGNLGSLTPCAPDE
jgi:hypothetical protein